MRFAGGGQAGAGSQGGGWNLTLPVPEPVTKHNLIPRKKAKTSRDALLAFAI